MNRTVEPILAPAMRALKSAFAVLALLSGLINILVLTGSMYMLQVYDRVLPSRSVPTLVALTIAMLILYAAQGGLDFIRTRIMTRIGLRIEAALRGRVFDAVLLLPLRTSPEAGGSFHPVRDLDNVRNYLSGLGPTALFDLPWLPLYIILLWLLHPWLGWFGLASAILLVLLTIMTEVRTKKPIDAANTSGYRRGALGESARRNAEVIKAMGMGERIQQAWNETNARHMADQLDAADAQSGIGTFAKVIRMVMQSAMLGLGAWIAIRGEVSAGVIIAATILLGRALAPIETAIMHWKGFVTARQSYRKLQTLLARIPHEPERLNLPRPGKALSVEGLTVAAPGQAKPIVTNVGFSLKAGDALGVIGPSASGKSTLVRALVGAWLPVPRGGSVRLDGATLDQYSEEAISADIGYLPQTIELFEGTIAQNIARMDPSPPPDAVHAAAKAAGCYELILKQLPEGFNTRTGGDGGMLSAGQRQRVALARALYGNPFLVILDEPNSNLDAAGDQALTNAIVSVRQRGGIVVIVAHRQSALNGVNMLLAMGNGQVQAFGPRDEVLSKLGGGTPPQRPAARPTQVSAIAGSVTARPGAAPPQNRDPGTGGAP